MTIYIYMHIRLLLKARTHSTNMNIHYEKYYEIIVLYYSSSSYSLFILLLYSFFIFFFDLQNIASRYYVLVCFVRMCVCACACALSHFKGLLKQLIIMVPQNGMISFYNNSQHRIYSYFNILIELSVNIHQPALF